MKRKSNEDCVPLAKGRPSNQPPISGSRIDAWVTRVPRRSIGDGDAPREGVKVACVDVGSRPPKDGVKIRIQGDYASGRGSSSHVSHAATHSTGGHPSRRSDSRKSAASASASTATATASAAAALRSAPSPRASSSTSPAARRSKGIDVGAERRGTTQRVADDDRDGCISSGSDSDPPRPPKPMRGRERWGRSYTEQRNHRKDETGDAIQVSDESEDDAGRDANREGWGRSTRGSRRGDKGSARGGRGGVGMRYRREDDDDDDDDDGYDDGGGDGEREEEGEEEEDGGEEGDGSQAEEGEEEDLGDGEDPEPDDDDEEEEDDDNGEDGTLGGFIVPDDEFDDNGDHVGPRHSGRNAKAGRARGGLDMGEEEDRISPLRANGGMTPFGRPARNSEQLWSGRERGGGGGSGGSGRCAGTDVESDDEDYVPAGGDGENEDDNVDGASDGESDEEDSESIEDDDEEEEEEEEDDEDDDEDEEGNYGRGGGNGDRGGRGNVGGDCYDAMGIRCGAKANPVGSCRGRGRNVVSDIGYRHAGDGGEGDGGDSDSEKSRNAETRHKGSDSTHQTLVSTRSIRKRKQAEHYRDRCHLHLLLTKDGKVDLSDAEIVSSGDEADEDMVRVSDRATDEVGAAGASDASLDGPDGEARELSSGDDWQRRGNNGRDVSGPGRVRGGRSVVDYSDEYGDEGHDNDDDDDDDDYDGVATAADNQRGSAKGTSAVGRKGKYPRHTSPSGRPASHTTESHLRSNQPKRKREKGDNLSKAGRPAKRVKGGERVEPGDAVTRTRDVQPAEERAHRGRKKKVMVPVEKLLAGPSTIWVGYGGVGRPATSSAPQADGVACPASRDTVAAQVSASKPSDPPGVAPQLARPRPALMSLFAGSSGLKRVPSPRADAGNPESLHEAPTHRAAPGSNRAPVVEIDGTIPRASSTGGDTTMAPADEPAHGRLLDSGAGADMVAPPAPTPCPSPSLSLDAVHVVPDEVSSLAPPQRATEGRSGCAGGALDPVYEGVSTTSASPSAASGMVDSLE